MRCFAATNKLKNLWLFFGSNCVENHNYETTNETVKRKLLNLLQENDDVKEKGLNKAANNVSNSQKAILIIRY